MKTLKKSLALLLSAMMLFSTFAFVVASAEGSNDRAVVDLKINAPVAGKKADEAPVIENSKFVPGNSDLIVLIEGDPETCYREFGKMPNVDEYMTFDNLAADVKGTEEEKYARAVVASLTQMVKNGIAWIEYEEADIQTLIDSGSISKEDYSKYSAEYGAAVCFPYLLTASAEYGLSVKGKDGKEYSTTARFMEAGEKFKEGKSYLCLCTALADVREETKEVYKAANALMPYCEKKADIQKKLETATGEEADELNSRLEALDEEYKDKREDYNAKIGVAYTKLTEATGRAYIPEITVNGKKTVPEYDAFYANVYDFGAAEKAPTILDKIIEFFNTIIEFFRNLFSSFKF